MLQDLLIMKGATRLITKKEENDDNKDRELLLILSENPTDETVC